MRYECGRVSSNNNGVLSVYLNVIIGDHGCHFVHGLLKWSVKMSMQANAVVCEPANAIKVHSHVLNVWPEIIPYFEVKGF